MSAPKPLKVGDRVLILRAPKHRQRVGRIISMSGSDRRPFVPDRFRVRCPAYDVTGLLRSDLRALPRKTRRKS